MFVQGHLSVVKYLLDRGADPNSAALCGASASHFAAEIGNIYIMETLLERGARQGLLMKTFEKIRFNPLQTKRCETLRARAADNKLPIFFFQTKRCQTLRARAVKGSHITFGYLLSSRIRN